MFQFDDWLSFRYMTDILHSVAVAGITVPKQQMSLVTEASIRGNGYFSGILGLGMRGLTTSYEGTNPANDTAATAIKYAPLTETMSKNGTVPPIFSIAMSRDDNRSFISFGGVPPVKTGEFATTPIRQVRHTMKKSQASALDITLADCCSP
jgi:hypothetical protein